MSIELDYTTIAEHLRNPLASKIAADKYGIENKCEDNVMDKIKYIWNIESLNAMRLNDYEKRLFAKHIITVSSKLEFPNAVFEGKTGDEDYFKLVEEISEGHSINRKGKELKLVSAATKYCGHHNREYPFYDRIVQKVLKKEFNCKIGEQNYRKYVEAFRDLQNRNGLHKLSLREIDYYLWSMGKEIYAGG